MGASVEVRAAKDYATHNDGDATGSAPRTNDDAGTPPAREEGGSSLIRFAGDGSIGGGSRRRRLRNPQRRRRDGQYAACGRRRGNAAGTGGGGKQPDAHHGQREHRWRFAPPKTTRSTTTTTRDAGSSSLFHIDGDDDAVDLDLQVGRQGTERVKVVPFLGGLPEGADEGSYKPREPGVKEGRKRRKKGIKQRCGQYGHVYSDPEWKKYHRGGAFKPGGGGGSPRDRCTVPAEHIKDGHPMPVGTRHKSKPWLSSAAKVVHQSNLLLPVLIREMLSL